jgi:transcriptional regulator with XRE-family HTH domain
MPRTRQPSSDEIIGANIRRHRLLQGRTQEQLAEALDISHNQYQKYESGRSQLACSRLHQIAKELKTGIGAFFQGLGAPAPPTDQAPDVDLSEEETELLIARLRLPRSARRPVFELIRWKALYDSGQEKSPG